MVKLKKITLCKNSTIMSVNDMKLVFGGQVIDNGACGLRSDKCSGSCGYRYDKKPICTMLEDETPFGIYRSCTCI